MAMVITDNSPSAGYVAWTGVVMTFKSIDYNVANGNSNKKYIWWDFTNPNDLQTSDTLPTLTDDDCVFLLNVGGTHYLIPGATIYRPELMILNTKARAYLSANQVDIPNNAQTKVLLNIESYDIGSNFDIVNSKFVVPLTGYYLIFGGIVWKTNIASKKYSMYIFKNGAQICSSMTCSTNVDDIAVSVSDIQYLTAADYVELYAYHYDGTNTPDIYSGVSNTFLSVHLLSI